MEEINVPPTVIEQLLQNAEDYGLAMAATATPEQIENMLNPADYVGLAGIFVDRVISTERM